MSDRTLLERLEAQDTRPPSLRRDYGALTASVLANLNTVFNARQGSTMIRADYGLPDFNDAMLRGADSAPAIARSIREQIERFEPRLVQVMVRPTENEDDPLSLRFSIQARFRGEENERILFETRLSDDGFVRVSR